MSPNLWVPPQLFIGDQKRFLVYGYYPKSRPHQRFRWTQICTRKLDVKKLFEKIGRQKGIWEKWTSKRYLRKLDVKKVFEKIGRQKVIWENWTSKRYLRKLNAKKAPIWLWKKKNDNRIWAPERNLPCIHAEHSALFQFCSLWLSVRGGTGTKMRAEGREGRSLWPNLLSNVLLFLD